MTWPTPQDYQEALQNPGSSLGDEQLSRGQVELDLLGLPKPRSGGFASVYRIHSDGREWAVRCFLRDIHDQRERYTAISDHLARARLPYTVDFTFLQQGIRVGGQWYPILKMEWVEGERLDRYIEKHLHSPSILLSLARDWYTMTRALQQASVAHGDLQHGNVLVTQGQLRLIDYDGMFVPSLIGRTSHETGHRNFQHPLRSASDFSQYLDNFSAWVVYISLVALAVDPDLWRRVGGGEECLLFRKQDFDLPDSSDILRALKTSQDERIRSAAVLFTSLLSMTPQQVLPLDGQMVGMSSPPNAILPSWLMDHVSSSIEKGASESKPSMPDPSPSVVDPSWILDFIGPADGVGRSVQFQNSAVPERVLLVSAVGAILLTMMLSVGDALAIAAAAIALALTNLIAWVFRYTSDPVVRAFFTCKSDLRAIEQSIEATERDIRALEAQKVNLLAQADAGRARFKRKQENLEAKERSEVGALQKDLQSTLSTIATQRARVQEKETRELLKIRNDLGLKISTLSRLIAGLDQAESDELSTVLQNRQRQHIDNYLRQFSIDNANIAGVGDAMKSRLKAAGFRTAKDIDSWGVRGVEGIGFTRARALDNWKLGLERAARRIMPQQLTQEEAGAIRAKYQNERRSLEDQRSSEQKRQKDEENAVRQRYAVDLGRLEAETQAAKASAQSKIDAIHGRFSEQYRSLAESLSKADEDTEDVSRKVYDQVNQIRRDLLPQHWQREKARQKLRTFEGLRFSHYVARVFLGSRTA